MRDQFAKLFVAKLRESLDGYTAARKEMLDRYNRVPKGGSHIVAAPTVYDQKRAIAGAAVFILTEWDYYDALPVFKSLLDAPGPIPVNRVFLLYCSHLLMEVTPENQLSKARRERLPEYRRLSGSIFPVSNPRVPVAAWDAKFDEKDWRKIILNKNVPFDKNKTILIRTFPNLSQLEDENYGILREKADIFQRVLISILSLN